MVRWTSYACIAVLSLTIAMNAPGDRSVSAQDVPNAPGAPDVQGAPDAPATTLLKRVDLTKLVAHPNVHPRDLARFPMPVVRPDPNIDHRMIVVRPDGRVHYTMPIIEPGEPVLQSDAESYRSSQDYNWVFMPRSRGQGPELFRILPDGSSIPKPNQK
jgi:hypothetical protein